MGVAIRLQGLEFRACRFNFWYPISGTRLTDGVRVELRVPDVSQVQLHLVKKKGFKIFRIFNIFRDCCSGSRVQRFESVWNSGFKGFSKWGLEFSWGLEQRFWIFMIFNPFRVKCFKVEGIWLRFSGMQVFGVSGFKVRQDSPSVGCGGARFCLGGLVFGFGVFRAFRD